MSFKEDVIVKVLGSYCSLLMVFSLPSDIYVIET